MLDVLIITGASKGIGASIVKKCSTICKKMIVIASSEKVEHITSNNCEIIPLRLDLTNYNLVYDTVNNTINNFDNINSLGIVLCGAQLGEPGGLLETNLDNWDMLYKCNVLGNLAVVKGCNNIIKSGAKTRIVFFSGGGGATPNAVCPNYGATKTATIRVAETLSIELSTFGTNNSVIVLSPGAIETDLLKLVVAAGGEVKTKLTIDKPTNFVYNFLSDNFNSLSLNGRFLHSLDNINEIDFSNQDMCRLRRIQ